MMNDTLASLLALNASVRTLCCFRKEVRRRDGSCLVWRRSSKPDSSQASGGTFPRLLSALCAWAMGEGRHSFAAALARCGAALVIPLVLYCPVSASAQNMTDLVVGTRVPVRPGLICRSPAARNAMLVHLFQRRDLPLPDGCTSENFEMIVRGRSPGTEIGIPVVHTLPSGRVQNLILPGAFLVADLLPSEPRNVYVFHYTNVTRVVFPDGRPGPELRDP